MAENDTLNLATLTELTDAFRNREQMLAQRDAQIEAKTAELSTLEARLTGAGAYELALAQHVLELESRLQALRSGTTTEELGLQSRLAELRTTIDRTEQALRSLQGLHNQALSEQARVVRRQLGGNLEDPAGIAAVEIRQAAEAQQHAVAHAHERQRAAAREAGEVIQ